MCSFPTVGVNYNFSSGKTGVTVGASNHKLAGRVDIILDVVAEQGQHFLAQLRLYTGYEDVEHVVMNTV